ncbi:MAG: Ig-like domain-containing protein [Pirellulales bacterium]
MTRSNRSLFSSRSRRRAKIRKGGLTGRRTPIGSQGGLEWLEPRALLAGDLLAAISANDADARESNDSISTATVLGSNPHVVLNDLTIDSSEEFTDVDYFRIVAPFTGSLTVTTFFNNSLGNLDLAIVDKSGDVIATSNSDDDDELLTIPVVKGNSYYAVVSGREDDSNVYSLDVLMSQAPAPFYVGLDSASDTGRSNTDGVTLATTPRFLVQSDLLGIEGVPVLTSLQANSGTAPGAAMEVLLTRVTDGTQVKGYADRIGTTELYEFRPAAGLTEGRYLLWAHWEIRDGQNAGSGGPTPAIGDGPSTGSTRIEIDTVNPTGSGPLLGNASDTGGSATDHVTNKDQPFFVGIGEPGAIVRLFANGTLVGQTVAQSDGRWEITSEPLRDNVYDFTVQYEDLAGRVTEIETSTRVEIDTLAPNTPYLDLVDSSDTGHSSIDNITSDNTPTLTMTTTDPNSDLHLDEFNYKFRIYLRPERNADGSVGQEVLIYNSATDPNIPAADKDADGFTSLSLLMTTITNAIPDGVNNLKLEVEDRAGNISPDYLLTIEVDTTPVPPVNIDMLTASDSGVVDTDNVTNKDKPAFTGRSKPMSTVILFANGEMVGQAVVQSDASDVGIVEGATANDGLGLWEITSEPLDDGVYSMVARVEDWTANVVDSDPLVIEVDTLAPNTPALDLLESSDTGRNNDDDITAAALLDFSMTTTDPLSANHLTLFPGGQNLLYRLYDRPENGTEVLIYSSDTDASIPNKLDGLTSANRVTANDLNLAEGLHNLKLEVEDRAGNISHDFLFTLLVDRTSPPGAGNLSPDSDTGIWGAATTLNDRITADPTPSFLGTAEANAIVSATIDGVPVGTTVAIPLSGDDAFQPPTDPYNLQGNWGLTSGVNLSEGEHTVVFTYEDPAGNRSTSQLQIFVDTTGPRIVNVTRNDPTFTSLFQPKPTGGPDPLLNSIVIHINDGPARTAAFAYPAIVAQLAEEEGNFRLVGDANGNIPIVDVNLLTSTTGPGNATMQIQLVFAQPLPDDRYTLTVLDTLADPAGNALDGESGATAPFEGNNGVSDTPPIFPSGDGQHGGSFYSRFTVDSRPEIGVWAAGSVWVDTNGNFQLDPTNVDFVNRDIIYKLEFTSDDIFAGNFAPAGGTADGFDKLAAYGRFNGAFRWLVDLTNDGVPDVNVVDGRNINGLPVSGQFDSSTTNGDEVAVFDGSTWYFDTNHDWHVDSSLSTSMTGYPVVGDFDGDGFDDLGTWTDDRFQLDLAKGGLRGWDGTPDVTFRYGFIGVRERPVAADMDQDGFDDLGLWVPDRQGTTPVHHSEWYWLISGGESLLTRVSAAENPISGLPEIDFTPAPFGQDKFAIYGDGYALPIVGNFDPPVVPKASASSSSSSASGSTGAATSGSGTASGGLVYSPLDTNRDGQISPSDALLVLNNLNAKGGRKLTAQDNLRVDTNGDGYVSPLDVLLVINELNKISRPATPAPAPAPAPAPEEVDAAMTDSAVSSSTAINQQAVAAALSSPAVDAAYDVIGSNTSTKRKVVG